MKKINVIEFCEFINENLEAFQEDMESRNFSNRNQKEWFKLLQDYLGLNKVFEITEDEEEMNRFADIEEQYLEDDEDEYNEYDA